MDSTLCGGHDEREPPPRLGPRPRAAGVWRNRIDLLRENNGIDLLHEIVWGRCLSRLFFPRRVSWNGAGGLADACGRERADSAQTDPPHFYSVTGT